MERCVGITGAGVARNKLSEQFNAVSHDMKIRIPSAGAVYVGAHGGFQSKNAPSFRRDGETNGAVVLWSSILSGKEPDCSRRKHLRSSGCCGVGRAVVV